MQLMNPVSDPNIRNKYERKPVWPQTLGQCCLLIGAESQLAGKVAE